MLSNIWITMLLVSIGGFAGATARYLISRSLSGRNPWSLPLGTLFVNFSGSYLLGWLWGHEVSEGMLALLGTGFMGAYTTFSTFNWESDLLMSKGSRFTAYIYLCLTYSVSVLLAMLGYYS